MQKAASPVGCVWILAGEACTNNGGGCLYVKTREGAKCYNFSEKKLRNLQNCVLSGV